MKNGQDCPQQVEGGPSSNGVVRDAASITRYFTSTVLALTLRSNVVSTVIWPLNYTLLSERPN